MSFDPKNALLPDAGRPMTHEEVLQAAINQAQTALRVEPQGKAVTSAPSNSAPITAAANITLAEGDVLFVQNLGTNPLFVRRGTGATSSLFNYVLQAAGTADDGTGGSVLIDDFVGVVSFAGTSVRYNAWKR